MFKNLVNLTRFLSSFLGKFLFRSYERSLLAIGYFLGRKENLGFFYKNSNFSPTVARTMVVVGNSLEAMSSPGKLEEF